MSCWSEHTCATDHALHQSARMSFEWDKRFTSKQPGLQAHMG